MKKTFLFVAIIIVIVIGAYFYVTRPVSAPTVDISQVSDKLSNETASSSLYRISQTDSKAEFSINEILYGKPKLVIGTTSQIAGDIIISGNQITIGTIKLDAKTLVTDSSSRNGAINRLILKTDNADNEFIVFKPISNDFTGTTTLDKLISFNITGDLTVSGITKPTTFAITITVSADKVTGTASTTIKRADFGLVIPNLSFIANVDDAIPLTATIIADKVTNP